MYIPFMLGRERLNPVADIMGVGAIAPTHGVVGKITPSITGFSDIEPYIFMLIF